MVSNLLQIQILNKINIIIATQIHNQLPVMILKAVYEVEAEGAVCFKPYAKRSLVRALNHSEDHLPEKKICLTEKVTALRKITFLSLVKVEKHREQ